jgi:hypothetical protein
MAGATGDRSVSCLRARKTRAERESRVMEVDTDVGAEMVEMMMDGWLEMGKWLN